MLRQEQDRTFELDLDPAEQYNEGFVSLFYCYMWLLPPGQIAEMTIRFHQK